MHKKNKMIEVYKDGELLGIYTSTIQAIYEYKISYHSIKKSLENDVYIKGYKFKYPILSK